MPMRTTLLATIRSQLSNQDALGTLILRGVLAASELVCALVIARVFKASGYGVYALVLAWAGLLGIPAAAGFDRLLIREIAVQRARDEWALARGLLNRSRTLVLVCSLVVAGGVATLAPRVAAGAPRETITAFQIGLLTVPLIAYGRVRQAALQGLGRVVAAQIPEALVQPLVLLTLAGALHFAPEVARTGVLAVTLYTLSAAAACTAGIVILSKSLPDSIRTATPAYRTGEWLRSAAPFVALLGFNVVMTSADTVLVGFLVGATDAGVYRLASQAAMLISFPLTCVNMAVAPRLAALYARSDNVGLQSEVRDAARTVLLLTLPVVVALGLAAPFLLRLFGPEFERAYPPLLVLCAGQLVNVAMGTSGYLLLMTRHEGNVAVIFAAFAVLDVLGALVLIPAWGILGAAVSTALSFALMSGTMAILARRRLGIRATLFALNTRARETRNV